jgi:hypothetical protein
VLIDLAVAQVLGGEAISDFQGLRHLAPVIGAVPSTPTVWWATLVSGPRVTSEDHAEVKRRKREVAELRRRMRHPQGLLGFRGGRNRAATARE